MQLQRNNDMMLFGRGVHEYSWRGVSYLLGLYLGGLFFAACITGFVFDFFQWIAATTQIELFVYLADHTFDEFFDRLRWIPVIAGLPWLIIACSLYSLRNIGLSFNKSHQMIFVRWFLLGGLILVIVMLMQIAFTSVELRENAVGWRWLSAPLGALLGALAVGLLEELVFRGLVFRIFYTAVRPVFAIALCSAFFAYTHFKVPDMAASTLEDGAHWWTGGYVGYWMLFGITKNFAWLPFLNLFAFGALLCVIYLRTRSLMACIGLHAGAVWVRLTYIKLCDMPQHDAQWFFGGGKVTDGLLPLILLVGLTVVLLITGSDSGKKFTT